MIVEVPIYDKEQGTCLVFTLEKMGFVYKMVTKRKRIIAIIITYDDPIELIYFGMTVIGDMTGIFKSALSI